MFVCWRGGGGGGSGGPPQKNVWKILWFVLVGGGGGGGGGGQVGAPTKQMSEKFCGFWSSIFAHFNALLSDLVTFKVSYSSFKVIFPAVSMDICSVVLTKTWKKCGRL